MKSRLFKLGILLVLSFCLGLGASAWAKETPSPVALLTQVQGSVEVSKDGQSWKKADRNKFLFAGYQVRTGADGSGKLIDQTTHLTQEIGAGSVVEMTATGARVISGQLSSPTQDSGNLVSSVDQRFKEAQIYTTVRRSLELPSTKIKLKTIAAITLSTAYPDLVWSSMGKTYAYRLVIDGNNYDVAATDSETVRFTVPALTSGEHVYRVDIVAEGGSVQAATESGKIKWLSEEEASQVSAALARIETTFPGDDFLKASFLDSQGVTVAAMDLYRKHFENNTDDTEMFPLLIRTYHDLGLERLQKESILKWGDMRHPS
ncbi:MAG: hypothetical protein HQL87_11485 [Magnetococcales bacterium]|nr:hypothetical protein [Magnetococcales bacterium]